jgi:hypothetical protein
VTRGAIGGDRLTNAHTALVAQRGLWKLPELWTRKRTRAHKLLGRRQTDAGAHSYHSPRLSQSSIPNRNPSTKPGQVQKS